MKQGFTLQAAAAISRQLEGTMDGEELLQYLETHARTDLGLVHKDHLRRLYELAGEPAPVRLDERAFWNTSPEFIDPLVRKARERQLPPAA